MVVKDTKVRTPIKIERGKDRPGLPRPLAYDGTGTLRPVPHTNSPDAWGVLHFDRAQKCANLSGCLVCAEHVGEGFIFVSKEKYGQAPVHATFDDLYNFAIDGAPLHERCMRMTVAHCAHIRDDLRRGEVIAVRYKEKMVP